MNNRKHNAKNPWQGDAKKVLCVCSAGLLRSPTMANILAQHPFNFNTRAAGITSDFALIPVDDVLLHWADEIWTVNEGIALKLAEMCDKPIFNLDIPDIFGFMDTQLQTLIINKAILLEKNREGKVETNR